jgi:hypothetical protein
MDDNAGDSRPLVLSEQIQLSASSTADSPDALVNDFGGFASHEVSSIDKQSEDINSVDDIGFGSFEAFADMSEATIPVEPSSLVLEEKCHLAEKVGDSIKLEGVPDKYVTAANDHHDMAVVSEGAATSAPLAVASNDDSFDAFGDFEVSEDGPGDGLQDPEPPAVQHDESNNLANDGEEFEDFGDFDGFETAPLENTPPSVENNIDHESSRSLPSVILSSVDQDDGGEFDEFGDFEAFDNGTLPEEVNDATTESGPKASAPAERPEVSVLSEGVRRMFQNVFAHSDPVAPGFEEGKTCSQLPFDVPMRKILVSKCCLSLTRHDKFTFLTSVKSALAPAQKIDGSSPRKSEEVLAKLKKFYEDLPRSPPSTVLCNEKWFPYSQYEFNRDGSPYVPFIERVSTTSVPEVLLIDLPTGFEARDSSSSSSRPSSPLPVNSMWSTQTVVDVPTTPKSANEAVDEGCVVTAE